MKPCAVCGVLTSATERGIILEMTIPACEPCQRNRGREVGAAYTRAAQDHRRKQDEERDQRRRRIAEEDEALRRRREEDDRFTTAIVGEGVRLAVDLFDSSPSESTFEPDGGSFGGGGASGDW